MGYLKINLLSVIHLLLACYIKPYSNQGESSWAVYPNIHSIIGFLQFIYLPTAFTGLFEESLDSNYYFADEYLGILEEYKTIYPEKK